MIVDSKILGTWGIARRRAYDWRYGLAAQWRFAMCCAMACLTGVLAQVRVPLPWTPVPLTGQVYAVLLAGVLMGKHYSAISQVLYVGLGVAGIPWFAGWTSMSMFGPTGGYLLGFIPAAALVGWLTDRPVPPSRRRVVVAMFAGVTIVYFCGSLQFALIMRTGLSATFISAVLPFAPLDAVKAVLAALLAFALLPGQRHPRSAYSIQAMQRHR